MWPCTAESVFCSQSPWVQYLVPRPWHTYMYAKNNDKLWLQVCQHCSYTCARQNSKCSQERKSGTTLLWEGGWWPSFERLKEEDRKNVQGFRVLMKAPLKYNWLGISSLIEQKRSWSQQWPASLTTNCYWHLFQQKRSRLHRTTKLTIKHYCLERWQLWEMRLSCLRYQRPGIGSNRI